jgi:hypothetical protein
MSVNVGCLSINLSHVFVSSRYAIPVAPRSVASVCGHPLAGIAGLNSAGGMDVCLSVVSVVSSQVEVSATSRLLFQSSPTVCVCV